MKKLLSVLFLAVFLSGCSSAGKPPKPPEDMLKGAFENFGDVLSANYEIDVEADIDSPDSGKTGFDFALEGLFDFQKEEETQVGLKLDGTFTDENAEVPNGNYKFELRLDKDFLYSLISEVPENESVPADFAEQFLGKWWKITLPPQYINGSDLAFWTKQGDESQMTAEEKAMKDLFEKTEFFKGIKYLGAEKILGENSFHYSATLDKEAVKLFTAEAMNFSGDKISAEDLENFDFALQSSDLNVEVWVGAEDLTLHKLSGSMAFDGKEAGKVDLKFDISFGELNTNLAVEIPADAQEFDPFSYLEMMQQNDAQLPAN